MCSPLHYSYLSTGHEPPTADLADDNNEPDAPRGGSGALPAGRDTAPPPAGQAPDQLRRLATDGRRGPAGPRV